MDHYMYNQNSWKDSSFKNIHSLKYPAMNNNISANQVQNNRQPIYTVDVPLELAKSIEGKYFVGIAEDLEFGNATHAWARLYNPPDSGVNLFVNVWTASDITSTPFRVQIFFNSSPPGLVQESYSVTPANTAFIPTPQPRVRLQYAIGVRGFPIDGIKAYGRNGTAGTTINSEENGKFIFPPGGSFLVFISNPETPTRPASGKIAFGWWEEPIQQS